MHFILDRRTTKGNASENRQKFLRRVRDVVKKSMQEGFKNKSIKEIGNGGHDIVIDSQRIKKSLDEPNFNYDFGDNEKWVLPGNDSFGKGDFISKPKNQGQGQGQGQASDDPSKSEDPFVVHITQEEFLHFFFEDLELPDLVKKDLQNIEEHRYKNSGFTQSGPPSKLSVIRSMKQSLMRRLALQSPLKNELHEKENLLLKADSTQKLLLSNEIDELEQRIKNVPYIDEIDLRFRNIKKESVPNTNATMICIMDNSGSMGEKEKTLSRKFFFLLYLFLNKKYKKIDLIFIHHTTEAREVTEEEFFSMKETGGTVVSSALDLTSNIIKERGLSKSNLYICQCSDGDNIGDSDNNLCLDFLNNDILPASQYYAYIQIQPTHSFGNNTGLTSLWNAYKSGVGVKHFSQQLIHEDKDIYQVFRKLFEKKPKK